MKTFNITSNGVITTVQASSLQKAANAFFGVEKAIRCMGLDGYWANHRHSKHNPSVIAKIKLAAKEQP